MRASREPLGGTIPMDYFYPLAAAAAENDANVSFAGKYYVQTRVRALCHR